MHNSSDNPSQQPSPRPQDELIQGALQPCPGSTLPEQAPNGLPDQRHPATDPLHGYGVEANQKSEKILYQNFANTDQEAPYSHDPNCELPVASAGDPDPVESLAGPTKTDPGHASPGNPGEAMRAAQEKRGGSSALDQSFSSIQRSGEGNQSSFFATFHPPQNQSQPNLRTQAQGQESQLRPVHLPVEGIERTEAKDQILMKNPPIDAYFQGSSRPNCSTPSALLHHANSSTLPMGEGSTGIRAGVPSIDSRAVQPEEESSASRMNGVSSFQLESLPHILGDIVIRLSPELDRPQIRVQEPSAQDLHRYEQNFLRFLKTRALGGESSSFRLIEPDSARTTLMNTRFKGKKVVETGSRSGGIENPQGLKRYQGSEDHALNYSKKSQPEEHSEGPLMPREVKLQRLQSQQMRPDAFQKGKRNAEETFQDCLKTYENMYSFDWDLKGTQQSRLSPSSELTTGAFWFYMNSTFFPMDLQLRLSEESFDDFWKPIEDNLHTFSFGNSAADEDFFTYNTSHEIEPQFKPLIQEKHVTSLLGKRRKFDRFSHYFRHLKKRAETFRFEDDELVDIKKSADQIPRQPIFDDCLLPEPAHSKDEVTKIQETLFFQRFEKVIRMAEKDLASLETRNRTSLKELYEGVQSRFNTVQTISSDDEQFTDKIVYKPEEIWKYGQDFISYVSPGLVQDLIKNKDWYNENASPFLMNLNYPCKLQTDFLKALEIHQKQRHDLKYRKIMDQMDKMEELKANNDQDRQSQAQKAAEIETGIKKLNQRQSAQIAQDDACCEICGSGDYEDDDQIVFCSQCMIPVHQQCYGVEKIPEFDWICNSCRTFGLKRGQMLKCFLCPRRGGAMKPTNIFSNFSKYHEMKVKNLTKKAGKNNIEKLNNQANQQTKYEQIDSFMDPLEQVRMFKEQVNLRLENNTSLQELITREGKYLDQINLFYHRQKQEIQLQISRTGEATTQLNEESQNLAEQEKFELNFTAREKKDHNTPEDYNRFFKRNEEAIEKKAPTDTLYNWAHLSCSMWMAGPEVTPKTPVKMNKMDYSKFNIGCVICGKKGVNMGAAVKCCKSECSIQFHVECAKRAGYCMEIERVEKKNHGKKEKLFKIFCESHRPFKIITEINEQNDKEIDSILKFAKTIEKCCDNQARQSFKPRKPMSKIERNKLLRQALQAKKQALLQLRKELRQSKKPKRERKEKPQQPKKWKEKDKKTLFDKVKDKYLAIRKIRLNLTKVVDTKKRVKKAQDKVPRTEDQREDLDLLDKVIEQGKVGIDLDDLTAPKPDIPFEGSLEEESQEQFKIGNPANNFEVEWRVTLSRDDFPWTEIAFEQFSPKDCYRLYSSQVTTAHEFLTKVLGNKSKYVKMLEHQLKGIPLNINNNIMRQSKKTNNDFKNKKAKHQAQDPNASLFSVVPQAKPGFNAQPDPLNYNAPIVMLTNGSQLNTGLYCICKGRVSSDFMVACESNDDCPNGGWLHPQCTRDLKHMSQTQIDEIELWYCDDCKIRRNIQINPVTNVHEDAPALHPDHDGRLVLGLDDAAAQGASSRNSQQSSIVVSTKAKRNGGGHQNYNNKDGELSQFSTVKKEASQQRLSEVRSDQGKKLIVSIHGSHNNHSEHASVNGVNEDEQMQDVRRGMESVPMMRDSQTDILGYQQQAQPIADIQHQILRALQSQAASTPLASSQDYRQRAELIDLQQRQQQMNNQTPTQLLARLIQNQNQQQQGLSQPAFDGADTFALLAGQQRGQQIRQPPRQIPQQWTASQQQQQLQQQRLTQPLQGTQAQQQQLLIQQLQQRVAQQQFSQALSQQMGGQSQQSFPLLQSQPSQTDNEIQQRQLLEKYLQLQQQQNQSRP